MHIIHQDDDGALLRFDRGEELMSGLTRYCDAQGITGGTFQAIGATEKLTLSFYHLGEKRYEDHVLEEPLEIVSILGNVAAMGDRRIVHMHGSFSRPDLSMVGGHIKELIVGPTCELTLRTHRGGAGRAPNDEIGLNLLCPMPSSPSA